MLRMICLGVLALFTISAYAQIDFPSIRQALPRISPSIEFSAVSDQEINLFNVGIARARIRNGTRIGSAINSGGVDLSFRPAMSIRIGLDSISLNQVRYDFNTGKFRLDTRVFLDLFGVRASFLETYVETILNATIKRQLPARMQVPGYNPWSDPNLDQMVLDARNMVTNMPQTGSTTALRFRDASARLDFNTPREMCIPIGDPENHRFLKIAPDASFGLTLNSRGPYNNPVLQDLSFRVYGNRRMVVGSGNANCEMSDISALNVRGATLSAGGRVNLDYEITAERTISNMISLLDAGLILTGNQPTNCIGCQTNVRLEPFRTQLDDEVQNGVSRAITNIVRGADGIIPGFSIGRFLGVNQ